MTVLLIEPDQVLQRIYSCALEEQHFHVRKAMTAQDAIRELEINTIDMIIIELQIAEHNGVEFIHELRSYPEWQDIPMIFHTFVPRGSLGINVLSLKKLGVVDYLYKPTTSLEKLVSKVKNSMPVVS